MWWMYPARSAGNTISTSMKERLVLYQRLAWYTFLCEAPAMAAKSVEKPALVANNRPTR